MMNKKAQTGSIQSLIISIAVIAVVIVMAFLIIAQLKTQALDVGGLRADCESGNNCTSAVNATIAVQRALDDIPPWFSVIIIVSIGAAILGLVQLFGRIRAD